MQLPNRKPGKYTFTTFDPNITQKKYDQLKDKLERLLKDIRPGVIDEVKRYGENGDFSENAEYQDAKGRLRGINKSIDQIKGRLEKAVIIQPPSDTSEVKLGHEVTLDMNGNEKKFKILGPSETNPEAGIISSKSPLGEALMGKKVGDKVEVNKNEFEILKIE
ncbi:MAG: GreA/GreB family elongation factor [Patescibacteria group bacterium]|nr:GreA/GreB family elongation factor [Patescibacteria group bacterium]